jgi:hypothetical protein
MMKKNFFSKVAVALFMTAAVLTSCSEDDPPAAPALSISPEQATIAFLADGTTTDNTTFVVTTNQSAWDAVSNQTWCKVTKTATGFTVSADANASTTAPAPATVTVTASGATSIVINVTQSGTTPVVVSEPLLHFTSKAPETHIVDVTNAIEWEVSDKPEWVNVEINSNSLTVTAERTKNLTERNGVITINAYSAGTTTIEVEQDAATVQYYSRNLLSIPIEHLSYNGRYAAGEYDQRGIVFDLYNLSDENYTGVIYEFVDHPELQSEGSFQLRGITNDGTPFARSVTPDGVITTKHVATPFPNNFHTPYLLTNGVESELPFPATYRTGTSYMGVIPDMISPDGKHIIGRINSNGSAWVASKWTRNGSGTYDFTEIGTEEDNNWDGDKWLQWLEANTITGLSASGKYLSGVLRVPQGGTIFNPIPAKYIPFVYNLETDALTRVTLSDIGITEQAGAIAPHVTDNGTLFVSTPYSFPFGSDRTPYVFENGQSKTFAAWVLEKYGVQIDNNGFVSAVSADESVLIWVTYEPTGFVNHFIVIE